MVSHLVLNDLFALWMKKHTQKRNKQEKEESLRPIVNITDFLYRVGYYMDMESVAK